LVTAASAFGDRRRSDSERGAIERRIDREALAGCE
jgi:hypothetical protein